MRSNPLFLGITVGLCATALGLLFLTSLYPDRIQWFWTHIAVILLIGWVMWSKRPFRHDWP
jgi:hypothetical protein